MTSTLKTLAIAGLMSTLSVPAFAAAHMSASMTCAEWKALDADDRMMVASMAIAELDENTAGSLEGVATATEDTSDAVSQAEATDRAEEGSVVDDTSPRDNSVPGEADVATLSPTEMEKFMVTCDQNLDAMVSEAAAGLNGTR